jgi:hypothetical protein
VTVNQKMEWSNEIDGAMRHYTIHVDVAPFEVYSAVFSGSDSDILAALDGPFLSSLNAAIKKELKQTVAGVVKGGHSDGPRGGGAEDEDQTPAKTPKRKDNEDSDAEDADEEDARQSKKLLQRGEKDATYGEDESASEEDLDLPGSDDDMEDGVPAESSKTPAKPRKSAARASAAGSAAILGTAAKAEGFDSETATGHRRWTYVVPVDAKERKLLMAEIVQSVARLVVLKQKLAGVTSCLSVKNDKTGIVDSLR